MAYEAEDFLALAEPIAPGSGYERRKRLDDFSHALRDIGERWDNRFVPERESLPEAYLNGRFRVVLKLKPTWSAGDEAVLVQVENDLGGADAAATGVGHFEMMQNANVRRYDQLVVLVDPIKAVQGVEIAAPSIVRLHLIKDETLRTGEGGLHRIDAGIGSYLTLPLMEWEHELRSGHRRSVTHNLHKQMIERRAQIMRHISDDQANIIWEWLSGANPEAGGVGMRVVVRPHFVQVIGVPIDPSAQLINVAIGPLDL